MSNRKSLDTLFAQAGGMIDRATGGVIPPLQASTTFVRDEDYVPLSPNHLYGRDDNDLVRLAEDMLAQAEGAEAALLFPSGMAAVAAAMRTVPNGGRIILQTGIYWGTTKWARDFCARRAIDLIEINCADDGALADLAVSEADMIWVETPSNPYLKVVDIAACSALAKKLGAVLIVDSTAATPVLANPLAQGADMVMHSATKGINGHSDVLAGVLATANKDSERWQAIAMDRHDAGAILGAFEAWLLIRGMRTMALRVRTMAASALELAQRLEKHDGFHTVLYPGLESHVRHALAKTQMPGGFGSLLSVRVKGGREAALKAVGRMNLFKRATSLGGVESLVEHRHTIEDTVPNDLLRLSVGIEDVEDLWADLHHALEI
ncbi:MAG: PLP-dependent transferase [Pseudomonadota bacterium]